jgi:thymidylate synthase
MSYITSSNNNTKTPATCHLTMVQFFVEDGNLEVNSYQRSADVILGVPHNWVQHWALFTWMAKISGLTLSKMNWIGGDIHLYDEESHIEIAEKIASEDEPEEITSAILKCNSSSDQFIASEFNFKWRSEKPKAIIEKRARLL